MGNTHKRYAPEYRRRIVELVRAGRNAEELAREFEPTSQSIRNWVAQARITARWARVRADTGKTCNFTALKLESDK